MPTPIHLFFRLGRYCAPILAVAVITGCAQQQQNPNYYTVAHDTTESDALQQAQGSSGVQAPSQIQLGFGDQQQKKKGQAPDPQAKAQANLREATRPLMQARTFLGTLPCINKTASCSANRITLTVAPTGEWRARTEVLGPDGKPNGKASQQGCWSVAGIKPLKILLQLKNDNTKASLTFVNDNVLRIDSFNGVRPNLDYHMTRQADVDAINELSGLPTLKCPSQAQPL